MVSTEYQTFKIYIFAKFNSGLNPEKVIVLPQFSKITSIPKNVSKNTAARAFILLEKLGLIKCITASNFDCRKKLAREWALTYQPIYKKPATNEWKQYKKS